MSDRRARRSISRDVRRFCINAPPGRERRPSAARQRPRQRSEVISQCVRRRRRQPPYPGVLIRLGRTKTRHDIGRPLFMAPAIRLQSVRDNPATRTVDMSGATTSCFCVDWRTMIRSLPAAYGEMCGPFLLVAEVMTYARMCDQSWPGSSTGGGELFEGVSPILIEGLADNEHQVMFLARLSEQATPTEAPGYMSAAYSLDPGLAVLGGVC